MRNRTGIIAAALTALLACGATGCGKSKKKEAIAENRQKWEESLKDSVAALESRYDSIQKTLESRRDEVEELLPSFSRVDNPRYVDGFYIDSEWKDRYPLQQTGIVARILDDESIELVAACSGNRFTAIELSGDGWSRRTATVEPDQALNRTFGGLTTVAFSGPETDSIAMSLAGAPAPVTITYLGASPKSASLTPAQARMLTLTARLWDGRRQVRQAEKELPATLKKLQILKTREPKADPGKAEE